MWRGRCSLCFSWSLQWSPLFWTRLLLLHHCRLIHGCHSWWHSTTVSSANFTSVFDGCMGIQSWVSVFLNSFGHILLDNVLRPFVIVWMFSWTVLHSFDGQSCTYLTISCKPWTVCVLYFPAVTSSFQPIKSLTVCLWENIKNAPCRVVFLANPAHFSCSNTLHSTDWVINRCHFTAEKFTNGMCAEHKVCGAGILKHCFRAAKVNRIVKAHLLLEVSRRPTLTHRPWYFFYLIYAYELTILCIIKTDFEALL